VKRGYRVVHGDKELLPPRSSVGRIHVRAGPDADTLPTASSVAGFEGDRDDYSRGIVGWQSIHPARDVLVKAFALIAPDQPAALVDLPNPEPGEGGRAGMCNCLERLRQENRSGRFNRGIRVWPPAAG